jgi:exopolyphosphatase/guanosine-5'-triphosphate,3'-diphosphate pyrophosphatase
MSCVLSIDLGSNSLQIVQYNCSLDEVEKSFLATVRTAQNLVETQKISQEAISRIIQALNEAKSSLDFRNCKIKAVTTQAMRVAKNSKEVLEHIKEATDIEFEVISAQKEGELTLKAVQKRLEKLGIKQDFVLVDIGGGSTELSLYIDGKIYSKSFDLGIVTTANSCKSLDEIRAFVSKKVEAIKEYLQNFDTKNLIFTATAGTPTTIAAMKLGLNYHTYDAKKVTGTALSKKELEFYLKKLLAMGKKEREIAVGVGRDDLIIAGIVIFEKIFDILEKEEVIVIDDGLAVGVAISECEKSL